jgi:hypothetical protein
MWRWPDGAGPQVIVTVSVLMGHLLNEDELWWGKGFGSAPTAPEFGRKVVEATL